MKSALQIEQEDGPEPDNPIIGPYVPGGALTLLVGPEGTGKSTFLTDIAVAVAGGKCPAWASTVVPGRVLWITTAEESVHTITAAFRQAGADDDAMSKLQVEVVAEALDSDDLLKLVRAATPALIIADPIDALAEPQKSPRRTLGPVLMDAGMHGYAVIGLLHTLHGARPGAKLVKGSGDWTRLARSILYFGPDPRHDPRSPDRRGLLFHMKANRGVTRGEAQEFGEREGWLGSVPHLTLEHLFVRPEKTPAPGTAMARAVQLLQQLLGRGATVNASEIQGHADAHGISLSTVDRAASMVGVVKEPSRDRSGKITGHLWTLQRHVPGDVVRDEAPKAGELGSLEGLEDIDGWMRRGNLN